MWKNVTTDHYSLISGNNFPNMNCIAVIGYKLQNGDMFFSFFLVFSVFLFFFIVFSFLCFSFFLCFRFFFFFLCFCFFSFFFSWVSRQWDNLHLVFNWENVSWGQKLFFLFFSFFPLFFFFLFFGRKNVKIWKIMKKCVYFSRKKGNHIRAARVFLARCATENSTILCALVAFWIPVWSVARFHFNFSAHPCRLQPMVLWPVRPNVIEKSTQWCQEWILSFHVWSGLCIACPYPCWIVLIFVLMDRWGTLLHCYTWPKTTLVPDVPFLSVVVRPRGQRCQNKISFDRLQPEQIKQNEVKSFEFYLFYMYIYFLLCIFISFYVI